MKIAKSTKERIAHIKTEVTPHRQALQVLIARLAEHSGTKAVVKGLQKAVDQLDTWQRTPI